MFELGTVSARASVKYSVFGWLVFIFFAMAISLLLLGSYARKEEVAGRVITRDVVRITNEKAAHIQEVLVANGDRVLKDQPLIRVRTIEPENINKANDKTLSTETEERLASLLQDLARDEQQARSAQRVQKDLLQLQIDQLRKDVALNETIEQSIQRRVSIASRQKQRHEKLAREGAISEVSLNEAIVRYETAIQDKANNQRALLSAQQRILELEQRTSDGDHALSTRMSEIARQRHELLERIQSFGKNQGYVLLSPVDGTVDAISIFAGGRAEAAYPMMLIRLKQSDPQPPTLMLDVSSSAIGFAAPGTEVIVRFDAFPYERYGVVKGRIIGSTASTYVDLPLGVVPSNQRQTPTYLVEVALDFSDPRTRIKAQWLKDGMTVRGSLRLEELSLIEWLFLPVIKGVERNPDFFHGLPSILLQGAPSA